VEAEAGKRSETKEPKRTQAKQRRGSEVLSQATKPLEVRKLKSGQDPTFYSESIRSEAKHPTGMRTTEAL
jgi:hypothetical protein